jgi:hypothetical protein
MSRRAWLSADRYMLLPAPQLTLRLRGGAYDPNVPEATSSPRTHDHEPMPRARSNGVHCSRYERVSTMLSRSISFAFAHNWRDANELNLLCPTYRRLIARGISFVRRPKAVQGARRQLARVWAAFGHRAGAAATPCPEFSALPLPRVQAAGWRKLFLERPAEIRGIGARADRFVQPPQSNRRLQ